MNNRGSFTVEAAMALPVFIFSIAAFILLFWVMLLQVQLQGAMTQASFSIQGIAYIDKKEQRTDQRGTQFESAAYKVLVKKEVEKYFLKGDKYNGLLARKISYDESNYQTGEEYMDLVANYTIALPLPIIHFGRMPVCQRVRTREFIGVEQLLSLEDGEKGDSGEDKKYVYVTETGTVYHMELSCCSLNLKISECRMSEVESKRNASGGKYKMCERCFNGRRETDYVFICEDGDRYHCSLTCSGLKRTIKKVPLEEIREKMRACYRCGTRSER